jgi:hypothetical protein
VVPPSVEVSRLSVIIPTLNEERHLCSPTSLPRCARPRRGSEPRIRVGEHGHAELAPYIPRLSGYPRFRVPSTSNALRAVSAVFRTGPTVPHSTQRTAQPPSTDSTSKKPLWAHRSTVA